MVDRINPLLTQDSSNAQLPGVGKTPTFSPLGNLQLEVKASRMGLLGLAPVFPAQRCTQAEVLAALGYAGNDIAESIFAATGVETRHLAVPLAHLPLPDGRAQQEASRPVLDAMAAQAARAALAASGVRPEDLGCLIINSTSGFHMPNLSSRLVSALRLPAHLTKYELSGAGCVGALPVWSLADDYLKAHPNRKVLAICVEVSSPFLKPGDAEDKETMVINGLFGDAAVGLVFGAGGAAPGWPELVDTHYHQAYDTLDVVYANTDATGVQGPRLSRNLADHAAAMFGPAIDELLAGHGKTRADIKHWIFHPGGPAILKRLQETFGLADEQLAPSWEVLKHYGNVSSPSCLIALERLVRQRAPQPGELGLLGAIGPGLTVGLALVQF